MTYLRDTGQGEKVYHCTPEEAREAKGRIVATYTDQAGRVIAYDIAMKQGEPCPTMTH